MSPVDFSDDKTPAWQLSARALGARFASRTYDPASHLATLMARIERIDPRINALVTVDATAETQAVESAQRWRSGKARGPLDGIPVAIKDNILARGMPTTWGSRAFAAGFDGARGRDECAVERLRRAGAIIIGKTNVPEFTLEGYTDNALFGVTRNPWDPSLTPGGSSGGSVAGVAAGLFPLALGTDGGGSIRRPASYTGLVALKPSIGAVPRVDALPQILLDFETVGPIARTVSDVRMLFEVIAGPDQRDHMSLAAPRGFPHESPHESPREPSRADVLSILYVPAFGMHPVDPSIGSSVRAAVDVLRRSGHRIVEGALPFALEALDAFWPSIGPVGLAHVFALHPEAEHLAAPKFVEMARQGRAIEAHRYFAGLEMIRTFRGEVARAFESIDVIVTPSAAAMPWPAAETHAATIDGELVGPRGHAVFTGWVNACGHPAINLPAPPSSRGLPIGFQLVGRFGADAMLLDLAEAYEAAAPWADRWPAIALER